MTDLAPTPKAALPPPRLGKAKKPSDVLYWRQKGKGKEVQVVEVHWDDAVGVATDHWANEHQIGLDPAPSLAIGYLIAETAATITVIAVVNENDYAHGITIPKGCITKMVRLA